MIEGIRAYVGSATGKGCAHDERHLWAAGVVACCWVLYFSQALLKVAGGNGRVVVVLICLVSVRGLCHHQMTGAVVVPKDAPISL